MNCKFKEGLYVSKAGEQRTIVKIEERGSTFRISWKGERKHDKGVSSVSVFQDWMDGHYRDRKRKKR